MLDYQIHGGKGGEEKPHTPVETPNNLLSVAYAKVLIAVAEGELAGQPTNQDIFLDGTPLANPDGSLNFGGVKWDWRTGTTDQTYIQGLPEVSTEYNVGVELKSGFPWVRNVTKTQLDAVRVTFQWPALLEQKQNGDTVGTSMDYKIEIATDGGAFVEYKQYNITGKTNTAYERTHRIDLPSANSGWIIRASKLTPDTETGTIQDTINIKSIAEVVDAKQRYPNTALLYVEFDSRMFGGGSIPRVSVRTKGRVIRVPNNYDPETRTYSGVWSGAFKWAWSDNPAWVFHDIMTQDRFGLGNKVDLNMVDKWALYEIAQYCDVMVDNGHGVGINEPRHTCNIYIQEKMEAWQVLRDIASIFNGMTYWNGNQFTAIADKQEPFNNAPVFSRSNVVNGRFDYAAADDKSIYTSALVSYDDPDNHYGTEVEATFETSQILRWGGDRQTEISAIGCTSRGEAQRRGKYTLITNMYNRTVSFRTGLQGLNDEVMPGKLIHVVDPLIGGRPFTGRIKVAVGKVLTLDRPVDAVTGDIMYVTRANGVTEGRTIASVSSNIVTLQVAYTEQPLPNAVWYLEAADLKSQLFRVTKITSPDENVFDIEAVEYNDSKYSSIDTGARLEPRPISVVPPNIQQPPSNIVVTANTYIEQTMAVTTMTASWDQTPNAVGYEVQWKVGNGDWVNLGVTGAQQVNVKGIYTGQYVVRVRAMNAYGIKSVWGSSVITQLNGKVGSPPSLVGLTVDPIVYGMRLNWLFPEGAEDTARTEIMYSQTQFFVDSIKLGDYAYPQNTHDINGLKAGQRFFFWGRLVDRTGNIGPYYPLESLNGVMGLSSTDVNEYEAYFRDQINSSALGAELSSRIDLIDGPPTLPGSVNERLQELDNQLQEQIDTITDLADSMPYNPSATYVVDQAVLGADGKLYQAKQAVPINTPPPNVTYWTDIGQAVTTADGLAARVTTVETTVTNQGSAITAQSTRIDGVVSDLNGKASSAAVDSLTTRVTSAEGTITSQGSAITGLQSDITGKADASAVNSLTTRVTTAEDNITSQSGQITTLTNSVAGKADASALSALSSTVTQQGTTITSQGTAVTQLQNTVGSIGGAGTNLLVDTYSWLTSATLPTTNINILTQTGVVVPASSSGFGYRLTSNSTSTGQYLMLCPINNVSSYNVELEAGSYLVSMYIQGASAGTARVSLYDGVHRYSTNVAYTTTRQRVTFVCTSGNATRVGVIIYPNMSGVTPMDVTIDSVMVEDQIGTSTAPSPFVPGNSASSVFAQATAINSLSTRVTNTEGVVSAQATKLDGIFLQVNPSLAGDNVGMAGSDQAFVGVWTEQSARIEDGVATGKRVDTIQVAIDQSNATVQQVSQAQVAADGKASASWSVKLQVNQFGQYVTAGVGLGLENTPGGLQSTFLVSADTFAVVNGTNSTLTTPFVVSGGQVFIKSAVIQDASISSAKIGQIIQSDNFVSTSSGWAINKNGYFEMNGSGGTGRMALSPTALKLYHSNGVLGIDLSI